METSLKKNIYDRMCPVWSGRAGCETGEDYVVPDTMPDIGQILSSEGILTVRGKETMAGSVHMSASVSMAVVYVPEDGTELRCLEIELPADVRMEAADADSDCITVARLRLTSAEARAVNSRKITLRAELEAEAECYRRDSIQVVSDLAEPGAAHTRILAAPSMLATDVREKTFTVTDEYDLPGGCGGTARLLSRRVEAAAEDVKYVSGKAVIRGRIRTDLLFYDMETRRACPGVCETEFTQIMEIGDGEPETITEASFLLTGVYLDMPEYGGSGEGSLQAEFHFSVQCVCFQRRELRYLADVYSNRTELIPTMETLPFVRNVRSVSVRQTVAGRAETPGTGEIIRCSAAVRSVTWEEGAVRAGVGVRLLCRDGEGRFFTARCRLSAEFTPADPSPASLLRNINVVVTDVYCPALTEDIRVTLRMDALSRETDEITCVAAVEESSEKPDPSRYPSFTMLRVPAGADMWTLARRYHSTEEEIAAVNEGREEGILLIPKAR